MDAYQQAAETVRARDPDRFIADLFAPQPARNHLLALHAFDAEIARIRFAVHEPALGEIRLQWWRDAIAAGEGGGNPIAEALLATIADRRLPTGPLDALLTARIFDLYNDPMPNMADFEGYAGETVSAVVQLGTLILSETSDTAIADASGHAGVALALRDALWRFPSDSARQQLFLPRDVFAASAVTVDDIYGGRDSTAMRTATGEMWLAATDHLAKATIALKSLPPTIRPAFLPLALIRRDLNHIGRLGPFDTRQRQLRWRRQFRLWRAARQSPEGWINP